MFKRPQRTTGYRLKLLAIAMFVMIAGFYIGKWIAKPDLSQLTASYLESSVKIAPFSLIDTNKYPYTEQSLKGHWTLVFFGYSNCPDICPTTLTHMAHVYNRLADKPTLQKTTQFVFVSVDPERDTPEFLKTFVRYFNTEFKGITGDDKEIKKLSTQLQIPYELGAKDSSGNYDVNHGANLSLINPDGEYIATFNGTQTAQSIADDLKLIQQYRIWKSDF